MSNVGRVEGTLLRPLQRDDLALVLTWRNHLKVRRFMYTQHEIRVEEHQRWFEGLQANRHKHAYVFELAGQPKGFVNINVSNEGGIADWGFYTAPDADRGTGRKLGITALDHAFSVMQLHKVCGEALAFNEPSIRFHESLGFQREGLLRDQHFDGTAYHSVIRFGLLVNEWQTSQ